MSKKQKEIDFIIAILDEVHTHFVTTKPEVRLVVKQTNLNERIFISSAASNPLWLKVLKKHKLSFRVLILKQNKPFVNIYIYRFIKSLFQFLNENKIEYNINNIEESKKYFNIIDILSL